MRPSPPVSQISSTGYHPARKVFSAEEAKRRIQEYGPNEITEKKVSPLTKFFVHFWGPIPWMIEVAVIISAALQRWEDFSVILLLLILNAVVGFWQERKADTAIAMLKKRLALETRVFRDGQWKKESAKELVPGDVIRVHLGDVTPADIKLVEGDYLQVDESALTGESLPVEKHEGDVAYSSSIIKQGEMEGLVVSTGLNTFFGKTAKLVEEARTKSHFQTAVVKIGDYLIVLAISLVAIVIITSLFRQQPLLETLQFALVLIVAAIPAALPAVLSITMAVGAVALAKKEAIVSKLVAIEEMAGVDVLCSDKTGTITKNELTLSIIAPLDDHTEEDVLLLAALTSKKDNNDAIDDAVLARAEENDHLKQVIPRFKVVRFHPFDPVSKRAEATVQDEKGEQYMVAKGAPQVILDLMENKEEMKGTIDQRVESVRLQGRPVPGGGPYRRPREMAVQRSPGSPGPT